MTLTTLAFQALHSVALGRPGMTSFSTSFRTTLCEASSNEQAGANPFPLALPSLAPSESVPSFAGAAVWAFSSLWRDPLEPGIQLKLDAASWTPPDPLGPPLLAGWLSGPPEDWP